MKKDILSAELTIRHATVDDIEAIQDIVNVTWPLTYTPLLGESQVKYMMEKFYSTSSLRDQMKNKHHFLLALKQSAPTGFASFSQINNQVFKLEKLYVLAGAQKTGTGKALLQTVEETAKSMGATKLHLNVNRKNIAKTFYEKNGFVVIKQVDIDIENGYFMNDYIMEKEL